MFKNSRLKWMPNNEQSVYEKELTRVMKHLGIENYNFNWDRHGCFIEFHYQDNSYRLEHSVEKAKKKGIILKNGLDCLAELTESLKDLCSIINRGTIELKTWISGIKQPSSDSEFNYHEKESPEFEEELQIKYKSLGKQVRSEDSTEEFIPFTRNRFQRIRAGLSDEAGVNKRL